MSIIEGVKDFLVGLVVVALVIILSMLLILLWPFITIVGWVVIMLLCIAIGILVVFSLILLIGKVVRGSYNNKKE